jgi:uncharacterized membrane protein YgdD (TMEM256/DUF423 family)
MAGMTRFTKNTLLLGCFLMALAVILGAFGAHALAEKLEARQLEVYKTGVFYHFIHGMGILLVGILSLHVTEVRVRWVIIYFGLGILLFSGSLYLLSTAALTGISRSFLGPVTPMGGLLFILGWVSLAWQLNRK